MSQVHETGVASECRAWLVAGEFPIKQPRAWVIPLVFSATEGACHKRTAPV
eukprot:CAMPEP_0117582494 /NCGR_PEP_ID=MMETSP0784-20121206/66464_1 /TAXON_ID=39447 /ORGANISM="" /LENGTH=50 /DNA_ID=CAMNT_0005383023 /DNA_START=130 /DNA_END=282 /DNA_ORIENTATION=-